MTPAAAKIILSKVETCDVNDPSLIGWEPVTDDLPPTDENLLALSKMVLDCNGLWNAKPIPHRIVRHGEFLALWTVPPTEPTRK